MTASRIRSSAIALFVALAAPALGESAQAVDSVVAVERAFARTAAERGIGPAFRQYVADEAVLFAPEPRPAKPLLAAGGDPPGTLKWWPAYAGIAASGDIGFTTGPYVSDNGTKAFGWYFTIWRRQPDQSWRWVIDHGPTTSEPSGLAPDRPVQALPLGTPHPASAETAWQEVLAEDRRLGEALELDARTALLDRLAEDGRVMRAGPQPAIGRAAYSATLASGPSTVAAQHLGGAASKAGDLAFTYGKAAWEDGGKPEKGHYIRIWQRRAEGWRLVVDELIPTPTPPRRAGG